MSIHSVCVPSSPASPPASASVVEDEEVDEKISSLESRHRCKYESA